MNIPLRKIATWTAIVVAVTATTYAVYRKLKKVKETKAQEKLVTEAKDNETKPTPANPTVTANDNFPLKKGSKGARVLAIQQKLGVQPQTSFFGDLTEGALKIKYNVATVDEVLYNKILTSKPFVFDFPVYDVGLRGVVGQTRYSASDSGKVARIFETKHEPIGTVLKSVFKLWGDDSTAYMQLLDRTPAEYVRKVDTFILKERPYNQK